MRSAEISLLLTRLARSSVFEANEPADVIAGNATHALTALQGQPAPRLLLVSEGLVDCGTESQSWREGGALASSRKRWWGRDIGSVPSPVNFLSRLASQAMRRRVANRSDSVREIDKRLLSCVHGNPFRKMPVRCSKSVLVNEIVELRDRLFLRDDDLSTGCDWERTLRLAPVEEFTPQAMTGSTSNERWAGGPFHQ